MDDDAYTIEELISIDLNNEPCPECGDSIDTGLGFGNRDLDCNADDCSFHYSYPADRYLAAIRQTP